MILHTGHPVVVMDEHAATRASDTRQDECNDPVWSKWTAGQKINTKNTCHWHQIRSLRAFHRSNITTLSSQSRWLIYRFPRCARGLVWLLVLPLRSSFLGGFTQFWRFARVLWHTDQLPNLKVLLTGAVETLPVLDLLLHLVLGLPAISLGSDFPLCT